MHLNEDISLRPLMEKDAPYMLEWMRDPDIYRHFRFDHEAVTRESVDRFISNSYLDNDAIHFAIVDHTDEYLGTVSLKNIDIAAHSAEYAIALRKKAQGRGQGYIATKKILEYAFYSRKLERVYLNVFSDNEIAINFYQRFGFSYEGEFINHIAVRNEKRSLMWFRMLKFEYEATIKRPTIHDVRILEFPQAGDERGHLVVIEGGHTVPFDIQRIFYVYGSNSDTVRGQHANRRSAFCLININGTSKVKVLDTTGDERIYALDRPYIGLYLPPMIWKDMYAFSSDSVLLVLSNEHYDSTEYIRDLNEFLEGTVK